MQSHRKENPSVHGRRAFVGIASVGALGLAIGCEGARSSTPIEFDLPEDGGRARPLELTPTISVWVSAFDSNQVKTDVLGILTLSSTVIQTTPTFDWRADNEQFFVPAGVTDLVSVLNQAVSLEFKLVHRSGNPPDAQLEQFGQDLIDNAARFQAYGKCVLSPSDWTSGAPSYGTKAYYFAEGGSASDRMRLLFDVNTSDVGELVKIVWLTEDTGLERYFKGAPDGTVVSLDRMSLSSIPTTNVWRYESDHV